MKQFAIASIVWAVIIIAMILYGTSTKVWYSGASNYESAIAADAELFNK